MSADRNHNYMNIKLAKSYSSAGLQLLGAKVHTDEEN